MAVDVGAAYLAILPSFDGFEGKVEKGTKGALVGAGTKGGKVFGDSAGRSMTARFGGYAKKAALVGAAAFAATAAVGFKLGRDAIGEAREAQKVGALTDQVIKSTGRSAKVTTEQVGNLAEKLSMKSGIDDEVIQSGANMILTFKNIRNETGKSNKIFDEATAAATDMAAAMAGGKGGPIDLKASSILVGKALNDPIKGLTALSRVGVSFTEQQKKKIETLVAEGDTLKAQKIILRELQSQFGGAAAAQATMGEKTSVAWGNIQEKLGVVLLPLVDKVQRAFLNKGIPALEGFVDTFEDKGIPAILRFSDAFREKGIPMIESFVDKAKPLVNEILPVMGDALTTIKDALSKAAPYAADLVGAFNDMPSWAKKAIAGGLLTGGAAIKFRGLLGDNKPGGGSGLLGLVTKAKPLPVFVTNPGGLPGVGGPGGPKTPVVPVGGPKSLLTRLLPWLVLPALGSDTNVGMGKDMDLSSATIDRNTAEWQKRESPFTDLYSTGLPRPALDNLDRNRGLFGGADFSPPPEMDDFTKAFVGLYDEAGRADRRVGGLIDVLSSVPGVTSSTLEILGIDTALDKFRTLDAEVRAVLGNISFLPGNVLAGLNAPAGPSINYNAPVTYTDDKEARRKAQQRERRTQSDNVRRGGAQ